MLSRLPNIRRFNFSSLKINSHSNSIQIQKAQAINNGKQIEINFNDNSQYVFHGSWMKDSAQNNVGDDYYRTNFALDDVMDSDKYLVSNINISDNGNLLHISFVKSNGTAAGTSQFNNIYPAKWLHSFAPFVGSNAYGNGNNIINNNSLSDDIYTCNNKTLWNSDSLNITRFNAKDIMEERDNNYSIKIDFFEKMMDPGMCIIENMDNIIENMNKYDKYDDVLVGEPLQRLAQASVGKLRMHHALNTSHWVSRTFGSEPENPISSDFDQRNPLAMHTDHSFFSDTSAYLIWMYQSQGDVMSKICDGLAVAKYIKEYYPNEFNLLSTINATHSVRNVLVSKEGILRQTLNNDNVSDFEGVQTHPIIQIDNNNNIKRIAHSEAKRGVCAIPFDIYDEYMNAYKLWCQLIHDDRFIVKVQVNENNVMVLNNWRILHGRGIMINPKNDRIFVGAYSTKEIFDNRYRYLHQSHIVQNNKHFKNIDTKSATRIPNQVLKKLIQNN
eukprot:290716_1